MKVPFSWLKEYVDIDVTAQELEEIIVEDGVIKGVKTVSGVL